MSQATIGEDRAERAGKNLVRTIIIILAIIAIFLVYAYAVDKTDINLEKPLNADRQETLVRVLRLLADPDFGEFNLEGGWPFFTFSEAAVITAERIVETIYMALLASAIGTLLAVPVSFLAARNLMENITWPLASISAAMVAIPIGGVAGWWITSQLVGLTEFVNTQPWLGLVALVVSAALIWVATRLGPPLLTAEERSTGTKILTGVRVLLALLLLIFGLAVLAKLGLVAGAWLEENLGPFGFLGNFLFVLADVLNLLLPAVVALLAGFITAGYASRYAQEAVLSWGNLPARILTGLLTLFGMAVLIGAVVGFFGWLFEYDLSASWILIAAITGGLLAGIVGLAVLPHNIASDSSELGPILRVVVTILKFLLIAIFSGVAIYFLGSLLDPIYDPDNELPFVLMIALVGSLPAAAFSFFPAPKHPYRIGFGVYSIFRLILNALRSIEPLIMGIVFVVWVGLGPFAGLMALTLHSIAALGKLFSEQVEGIDEGPVEAITATGASRLQMVVYAVIPQVVTPFTAFALYRWDINVRMSTIIGLVGGGGIGFVLLQNIRLLHYRQASVMMLAIAVVVAALDYASSKIRSRII
jgi:phosphonate ABC transporter permease subunit PhnE